MPGIHVLTVGEYLKVVDMLALLSSAFSSVESVLWFVDTFMTLFSWRCLETNQNEGVLLKQKHMLRLYIARRHGTLSIQQKFRFEISEISGAQWSCTFRYSGAVHYTDPTQATARLVIDFVSRIQKSGTGDNNFVKWKGTCRPTDQNDQTGQSWSRIFRSDQTEMVHSIWCTNRNFRNLGLNGKRPWTEARSTSIRFCLKTDIFSDLVYRPHVSGENGHWKRIFSKTL